jgi:alpha-galactosidase
MTPATHDILTNSEVIAVDQDRLGVQGHRIWRQGTSEVWMKPLAGGARALLLLNRGEAPAQIAATWAQLDWPPTLRARIRDLWQHRDLPRATGQVGATVAPHGVVMLRVEP